MSGPSYPNQQLKSVNLECYFKGRIGFRAAAERFQDSLGGAFPNLYVPNAQSGAPLDLQPYQMRSVDDAEVIGFAANQLTYVAREYPGHSAFTKRGLSLMGPALNEFGVQHLERVGYRYENEIAIGRDENECIPLSAILKLPGKPWWDPEELIEVSTSWRQRTKSGNLAIEIGVSESQGADVLRICVLALVIPGGPAADLSAMASKAHDEAFAWFDASIADEFRKYIRGDSDE